MPKIRIKNVQTAQGMVEFALVLPVLLLVILGVFAFGHMFFVYSSVVSASREAARWGAAVGSASEGPGALPRYQDCGAIKAAAVRVGAFAGVGGDSVAIDYDTGPSTTVYNHCPVVVGGTTGPEVGLGDRIIVTVTVHYQPIVPFINLPKFDLTATSARTIIKSLPVGDAPTAQPLWPQTTVEISPVSSATNPPPLEVVVGQPLRLTIKTWDEDSLTPTGGYVQVNDEAGNICYSTETPPKPTLVPSKTGVDCTFTYAHVTAIDAMHTITARYVPDGAHYLPSSILGYSKVNKAPTAVTITSPSLTTGGGAPWAAPIVYPSGIDVSFHVNVAAPGVQMTTPLTGVIRIDDNGNTIWSIPDYTVGSEITRLVTPPTGAHTITVTFEGTDDYLSSSYAFTVEVLNSPPTPTFTVPPSDPTSSVVPPTATTPAPNVTPSPTSAATALPSYCPQVNAQANKIFTSYGSSFYFEINNPKSNNGGLASTIDRIEVTWPSDYNVQLKEVRFGTAVSLCDVSTNCLLNGLTSAPPTASFTSGFNAAVNSLPVDTNQATNRQMLLVFNGAPPSGAYTVKVHFADASNRNCQIQVDARR